MVAMGCVRKIEDGAIGLKPEGIKEILSAGWGAISYRQNSELFVAIPPAKDISPETPIRRR
jgi:hypothetical protein